MSKFTISALTMKKWGKRVTLISAPNSELKAGLDLPDNFVRPKWSRFHGVYCKMLSILLMSSEVQVCASQWVRWDPVVPSCPRKGIQHTGSLLHCHIVPHICSCTGWWPREDLGGSCPDKCVHWKGTLQPYATQKKLQEKKLLVKVLEMYYKTL